MKTNPGEHNKQEERKGFYKNLFRFNALFDIAIDEEEFVSNKEKENVKIIEGKWSKVFQEQEKTWKFSDFEKIFQTSKEEHFDLQLQDIWENFINELDSEITPQEILRKKGTGLLLLAKYTRALQLSDPLQKNLSKNQDTLTRFVSANLTHLYSPNQALTEESAYLQTLLLLECAACASGEATIGFLNLAESAIRGGPEEEFKERIPYFDALIEYNKAIAYSHTDRKEKALDSSIEVTNLLGGCLEEKEEMRKQCAQSEHSGDNSRQNIESMTKKELRLYLEIPANHLKAELLNKMQCCFNAIETLRELLKNDENRSYKDARARLLEIPCWLDMGDFHRAEQVVSSLLKNQTEDFLPPKLMEELARCANLSQNKPKKWIHDDLKNWLKFFPSLRTDAIKLILQWDHERWKEKTRIIIKTNEVINEDLISEAEDYIKNLKTFIKIFRGDRFQRQNLKELAVDWLESMAEIKEIKKVGENINHSINSLVWRNRIKKLLCFLDIGKIGKKDEYSPVKREGDIANEIWGKSFKRFDPSFVERLLDILSKLTDDSVAYFHEAKSSSDKANLNFMKILSKFEMKVLGLNKRRTSPDFYDEIEK